VAHLVSAIRRRARCGPALGCLCRTRTSDHGRLTGLQGHSLAMPYAQSRGARIFWEEDGTGDPVLLIMGHRWSRRMWYRVTPALTRNHRVILFDNRGVGDSDAPKGPYTIPLMADDARAVLDAANVESAHVYGVSMGGVIAQHLGCHHRARVRSLILGGTAIASTGRLQRTRLAYLAYWLPRALDGPMAKRFLGRPQRGRPLLLHRPTGRGQLRRSQLSRPTRPRRVHRAPRAPIHERKDGD
jgi:pimeloyl-ACP methyl ester carboxylesterase